MTINSLKSLKRQFFIITILLSQFVNAGISENDVQINKSSNKVIDSLIAIHAEYVHTDTEKAFKATQMRLAIVDSLGLSHQKVIAKLDIGYLYLHKKGDFENALKYYFESLNELKLILAESNTKETSSKFNRLLMINLFSIGNIYNHLNYYPLSLKYYNKAENMITKETNISDEYDLILSYITSNKAIIYRKNNDLQYAKTLYNKAMKIYKKKDNKNGMSQVYVGLSNIYSDTKEYEKALVYTDSAIAIDKKLNNINELANSLNNKAEIFYNLSEYKKAVTYLDEALELLSNGENKELISLNQISRGRIYLKIGKIDIAKKLLIEELQNSKKLLFNKNTERICETLISFYEEQKDEDNIIKYKSELFDLKVAKEEHQDDKAIIDEKYVKELDAQADLFDFRETIYKKSNRILMIILSCISIQLIILLGLKGRKKMTLT